jgi:hypothetical protein
MMTGFHASTRVIAVLVAENIIYKVRPMKALQMALNPAAMLSMQPRLHPKQCLEITYSISY